MLVPKNRGFKRQYVYGGAGMFDSIANFFTKVLSSNVAKQGAQRLASAVASTALTAGKKAIDVGGKAAIERLIRSVQRPKALTRSAGAQRVLEKKSQNILSKYIPNINAMIDGSGVNTHDREAMKALKAQNKAQNKAIAIQDLVRKLNGSGLKMV